MTSPTPANPTVTFYDNYVPTLKADEFTISVSQDLVVDTAATIADGGDTNVPAAPQAGITQKFIVRGPRFTIDPPDMVREFPPKNGSGVFDQFFPMVVFDKRALPWEREMDWSNPSEGQDLYPWMALVVFTESELPPPLTDNSSPPNPNNQANPTRIATVALTDAVTSTNTANPTTGPPAGIIGPSIFVEDDEDPGSIQVNVIDVPAAVFGQVMPTGEDSRFLAHTRQVPTDHKVPADAVHDGWFAAVVANRLSPGVATGSKPQTVIAHLVSLEGLEAELGTASPANPAKPVRMISLHSWTFTELADPAENFRELMLELISDQSEQGTDLMLRLPVPPADPDVVPDPVAVAVSQRLAGGYSALDYQTRSGEATFAWYRGPLAAAATKEFLANSAGQNPLVPTNATTAMIYDDQTGLFDQSYSAAFGAGRALALSSKPFATALLQWRRQAHGLVDLIAEAVHSPQRRPQLLSQGLVDASGTLTATGVSDLAAVLDADLTSNAFVDFLATDFADSIASAVGKTGGFSPGDASIKPSDPSGPTPPTPSSIAALMSDPSIVDLLGQLAGEQTTLTGHRSFDAAKVPDLIVNWLAKTSLLYGVPFDHLVPSPQFLPEQSIRFFYVDPNWIDALIEGALSAGAQTTRDTLFASLIRQPLKRAVESVLHEVRDRLRGVAATPQSVGGSLAGFLLRSPVVSGWPGLEVRAYADSAGTKLLKPLRLDRLAPSVMFAIYPSIPQRIEFDEPSEGLVFGQEDQGVFLRFVPGVTGATASNVGAEVDSKTPLVVTPAEIAATARSGDPTTSALQISGSKGLVSALESKLPGAAVSLTPGSFAVQMIKVPEQMLFMPVTSGANP